MVVLVLSPNCPPHYMHSLHVCMLIDGHPVIRSSGYWHGSGGRGG